MSTVANDTDNTCGPEQPAGLTDDTRAVIRKAYQAIAATPGFCSRGSQRRMIAEVAKTLCGEYEGEPILAVEGPAGTGKSLGYLLAAIPVGQALGKPVIVSTATVALQEQLVNKDLPDLQQLSGLSFTYMLAKGRRRYVCDRNLQRLTRTSKDQTALDFGSEHEDPGSWQIKPGADDLATVEAMATQRKAGDWSGDLDEWATPVRGELAGEITTDNAGCSDNQCPFRNRCAFFDARARLWQADVVVVNHALLLSDLMLGGGVILSDPDETLYVIDEGHHLPDVALRQGEARASLAGPQQWLPRLPVAISKARDQVSHVVPDERQRPITEGLIRAASTLDTDLPALQQRLTELAALIRQVHPLLNDPGQPVTGRDRRPPWQQPGNNWRFVFGQTPQNLVAAFEQAHATATQVSEAVTRAERMLRKALRIVPEHQTFNVSLAAMLWFAGRLGSLIEALGALCEGAQIDMAVWPTARWIECVDGGVDFICHATPTNAADLLRGLLWHRCAGAIVTSATLTALGRFDRFFEQAGLGQQYGTHALKLPSPFDYANNAVLDIPADMASPKSAQLHTNDIIDRCNEGLIDAREGTLMLFSSWKQLKQVMDGLDTGLAERALIQGDAPRHELLATHHARIEAGEGSILCGVASFAEGIDLPGKDCTHVIIAKIPFAVPDSPVDATRAEWLEARGRNPFMELAVPEASFRLIQAAGRLLRSESDTGRVTILDPRLREKSYGRMMVKALPPFRRPG